MAGHRHDEDGAASRPLQRAQRPGLRRERMQQRLALAEGPRGRLDVAYDYLRGAASRRQPDPEYARGVVDDAVRVLVASGDKLLNRQAAESLFPVAGTSP